MFELVKSAGVLTVMRGGEIVARVQTHALAWVTKDGGAKAEEHAALPAAGRVIDFCLPLPASDVAAIAKLVTEAA